MLRLHFIILAYCAVVALLVEPVVAVEAEKCPPAITANWPSIENKHEHGGRKRVSLNINNQSPVTLSVLWVSFEGEERTQSEITSGVSHAIDTFWGHHFRIYAKIRSGSSNDDNGGQQQQRQQQQKLVLLKEHSVTEAAEDKVIITGDCDELVAALDKHRATIDKEMKELVHDQSAQCLPPDNSSQWSCVHPISKQDYDTRLADHSGTLYGFNGTDESQTRAAGETVDTVWSHQIPLIPRLSQSPGYLKMTFTKRMRDVLLPWYELHKKGGPQDSVKEHIVIPGGFTNSHTVPMSILNLDSYPDVKQVVVEEMQKVLEWWTGGPLVPTSTFGIRIYHQDSMLINHVDRSDTHLASAVIQVGQDGVDEGWPLEVLHPTDGSCSEIYLQPGEMVLYEGARFRHGRPMRFQGADFANVFSHFRPVDWHGPNESPNYDGKLDKDGFVMKASVMKELMEAVVNAGEAGEL